MLGEQRQHLEPGLNVLTGETGAGKSIVVGAINLVLGGKASADHVRPGASEAEVEALFDLSALPADAPLVARLTAAGAFGDGPADELAIRRVIQANGRSRSYLNGKLWTAADLAAIAPELADVSSQHESVKLTDPATHLEHLDRFAKLVPVRSALARAVEEIEALVKSVRELSEKEKTRGEREAFVRFMLQAITDVDPKPNEIEELGVERKRLRHAGQLQTLLERSTTRLDGEEGICDQVARVASDMRAAADLDARLDPLAKSLDAAYAELRDVASECARFADSSDGDPGRLAAIEERLYRLEGLLRQHGPTVDDVLVARARFDEELDGLAGAESRIAEQERAIEAKLPDVRDRARSLSAARKISAGKLGEAISAELAALGMGGARVLVEVEPAPPREAAAIPHLVVDGARLGREGIDKVEFLIAPNKGLEPKPLRKIASGGELSRALLALKRVLADHGPGGLYVFDEVDTGVGGAVAERIGSAIADVAKHHQVLAITHLAPIAAFADTHFVVTKSAKGDTTASSAYRVSEGARVREVARMLSGAKITEATENAARELIADAEATKAGKKKTPNKKAREARP
jgi:DNA repair protein RecN (Recombination protein N)